MRQTNRHENSRDTTVVTNAINTQDAACHRGWSVDGTLRASVAPTPFEEKTATQAKTIQASERTAAAIPGKARFQGKGIGGGA
jgi:hypothetical protein